MDMSAYLEAHQCFHIESPLESALPLLSTYYALCGTDFLGENSAFRTLYFCFPVFLRFRVLVFAFARSGMTRIPLLFLDRV